MYECLARVVIDLFWFSAVFYTLKFENILFNKNFF